MRKLSIVVVFTLGVVSGTARSLPPQQPVMYSAGDDAFRQRYKKESALQALEIYRDLNQSHPQDPESGWRHSMACQFVGMRLTEDTELKKELFAEGKEAGLASVDLKEDCGPCHFWTAVNMALYGQTVGPLKTLFSLKPTREHLIRSLELEPTYAFGGANRILGIISWKLPGLLGGSDADARVYMQNAIAASPNEPMNYWFLSQLLLDAFNDPTQSLVIARQGMSLPEPGLDRIEAKEAWLDLKQYVSSKTSISKN